MALPFGDSSGVRDARTLSILAKTIYRELRDNGFEAADVITLAGELLGQLTSEVRASHAEGAAPPASTERPRGIKPL